ncbi:unnamed protein product [Brachionus calyciflorus]|uniref:Uncharacterized protein n=1 Tax=Brachionus calyciflorus TaxID=104777 RepID=A0A813V7U9_9BILA|nr:unnamed protein product [Brachionus calyciflorus]
MNTLLKGIKFMNFARNSSSFDRRAHNNLERIAKRVILEFKNNDKIYLTENLRKLIKQFYIVKHINLNFCEIKLDSLDSSDQFDLCVLNLSDLKDFNLKPVKNFILIIDESNEIKIKHENLKTIISKTKPKLVLSENFVFKYDNMQNILEPIEVKQNESNVLIEENNFLLKSNQDTKKKILQECF